MRNWIAGIVAVFGLLFFFLVERNLTGFIVLVICAAVAAVVFSEKELDERVRKIRSKGRRPKKEG